jgi:uncharacterized repeat protein (TIGR01451 family)
MKSLSGRGSRQLVLGLTLLVALATVGLLLGSSQAARANVASLETSTKTASPEQVSPGSVVTYTIVVRNDGVTPVGPITVSDALPDEVDYVPFSAFSIPEGIGYVPDGPPVRNLTFTIPSLAADASVTVGFEAQVRTDILPDTVFTNTAVIDDGSTVVEPSAAVTVQATPEIAIKTPWDNQLFTTRGQFVVSGRAWTPDQTPEFPGVPVLRVLPDPKPPTQNWYRLEWDPVPGAWFYTMEEALDPHFDQLTSFDGAQVTSPVNFSAKAPGTYYYRLLAYNAYEGFWSDPVAVTVASTASAAEAFVEPSASDALLYQPTIEINIKPVGGADDWRAATSVTLNAGGWWDWTYNWELPVEDDAEYAIEARAKDEAGNYDPDAIDSITVTIRNGKRIVYMPVIMRRWPPIPYPPVLSLLNNDNRGNYTLSWTYSETTALPTSYWIQEARDAAFTSLETDIALPLSPTSYSVTNRSGTLYYRVAGVNAYGRGEWSNVVSVTSGYLDDFSDNTSGWPRSVVQEDGRNVFDRAYEGSGASGNYRAKIMLSTTGLNNYRVGTVRAPWENPYTSYQVEVQHYFAIAADQAATPVAGKGGLIFGGNVNLTTFYVLEWNFEGDCAISKYVNVGAPLSDPRFSTRVAFKNWGVCGMVKKGYNQVNAARVIVEGNRATAYINDQLVATFTDNDLNTLHHVGFLTGSWERTPVEGRYDNFRVTPR